MFVSLIEFDLVKSIETDAGPYQAISQLVKQEKPVCWKTVHETVAIDITRSRHRWQKVYRLIFSNIDLNTVREEARRNRYVYDRYAIQVGTVGKYIIVEEIDAKYDYLVSRVKTQVKFFDDTLEENKEATKEYIIKLHKELYSFMMIYVRNKKQEVELLGEQVRNLT